MNAKHPVVWSPLAAAAALVAGAWLLSMPDLPTMAGRLDPLALQALMIEVANPLSIAGLALAALGAALVLDLLERDPRRAAPGSECAAPSRD